MQGGPYLLYMSATSVKNNCWTDWEVQSALWPHVWIYKFSRNFIILFDVSSFV